MDSTKDQSIKKSKGKKIKRTNTKENFTYQELEARYEKLYKENSELDKKIAGFEAKGVSTDLQPQMQALHEYNEMKDLTQMVLGYLADAEQITVGDLHRRYSLPLE